MKITATDLLELRTLVIKLRSLSLNSGADAYPIKPEGHLMLRRSYLPDSDGPI